jgi:hypothetical protein
MPTRCFDRAHHSMEHEPVVLESFGLQPCLTRSGLTWTRPLCRQRRQMLCGKPSAPQRGRHQALQPVHTGTRSEGQLPRHLVMHNRYQQRGPAYSVTNVVERRLGRSQRLAREARQLACATASMGSATPMLAGAKISWPPDPSARRLRIAPTVRKRSYSQERPCRWIESALMGQCSPGHRDDDWRARLPSAVSTARGARLEMRCTQHDDVRVRTRQHKTSG